MAFTDFQRDVCRLLASSRREHGDSYVAGGAALTQAIASSRVSRVIDVFHDTAEAVAVTSARDRATLEASGWRWTTPRERPGFVEALVCRDEALACRRDHGRGDRRSPAGRTRR